MQVFAACGLTVLVETVFLVLCGYRDARAITVIICANIITNLTLNAILTFLPSTYGWWLVPLEAVVVAAEYAIFAKAFEPSRRLFWLTLAANALSFCVGLLLL